MSPAGRLCVLYQRVFASFSYATAHWVVGSAARLIFGGVLLPYYFVSALTKVGEGFVGFFTIADGAYFQIFPNIMEQFSFDPSQVPLLPYGMLVILGTYGEFLFPILIVIGLFTRLAALGMIVFIGMQTYVDIVHHAVDDKTIGALFDRFPDSAISDQRSLWVFLLMVLVWYGPGILSTDYLLGRWVRKQS